jgi:catechol 2,3-dioxygenase-like lactoylglutathione lyase family enzyme
VTGIRGVHHFAYSTSEAEREIRFHEDVLGLRLVRREPRTLRGLSGEETVFGVSDSPSEGFLVAFCLGEDGPTGRQGSNGPTSPNLAVPAGSLDSWQARLRDAHVESQVDEVYGTKRLVFTAPSRIRYTLVETGQPASGQVDGDPTSAVRGLHSATISLMDVRETHSFLLELFGGAHLEQDLASGYYQFSGGAGVELLHEPYRAPGTWTYAVGTPHHIGLDVADEASREQICERLRDAGYCDVSPVIDGPDSSTVWVRAPGGALVALVCPAGTER